MKIISMFLPVSPTYLLTNSAQLMTFKGLPVSNPTTSAANVLPTPINIDRLQLITSERERERERENYHTRVTVEECSGALVVAHLLRVAPLAKEHLSSLFEVDDLLKLRDEAFRADEVFNPSSWHN